MNFLFFFIGEGDSYCKLRSNRAISKMMQYYQAWEQQLRREYENILWQFKIKGLTPPFFKILPVKSYWGQWDPLHRRISLSQALIEDHSWDHILKILKHEMAHQIVHELFGSSTSDHGVEFRRACHLLGLEKAFQGSQIDINNLANCNQSKGDSWKFESAGDDFTEILGPLRNSDFTKEFEDSSPSTSTDRKDPLQTLLIKVQRLMALSSSTNENEAIAAMEKVQELIEKYNIERIALDLQQRPNLPLDFETLETIGPGAPLLESYTYRVIQLNSQKVDSHHPFLVSILEKFYFVRVIFSSSYNAKILKEQKTLEIFGTPANVEMAEYVFHFLNHQILQGWQSFAKRSISSAKQRKSYLIGAAIGFQSKLSLMQGQRNQRAEKSTTLKNQIPQSLRNIALIKEDSKIDIFLSKRHPRLARRTRNSSRIDSHSYLAGTYDGQKIIIQKGIKNHRDFAGSLLSGFPRKGGSG